VFAESPPGALTGSPVVRLNWAVAIAEARGPAAGLKLLDGLDRQLPQSHRLPAARATLLVELGRIVEARAAYVAIDRWGTHSRLHTSNGTSSSA